MGCLVGVRGPVPTSLAPAAAAPSGPAAAAVDDGDDEDDAVPSPAQPAPKAALPPGAAPTPEQVERELSPYGKWIDTPDYGRVWVPASQDPNWQPYTDGSWVYTPYGWSFAPTVAWGWLAFHYGRWGWGPWGWFWEPGYVWGPAWVSWRRVGVHYCWSPYAPRGYVYGRRWPGWVVVPREHFRAPIATVRLARPQAHVVLRSAGLVHPGRARPEQMHAQPHAQLRGTGKVNHFSQAPGSGRHGGKGHKH